MEAERPEPHESVDDRQFVDLREQLLSENNEVEKCPECGCGFVAKYEDGKRICLYCPNEWSV